MSKTIYTGFSIKPIFTAFSIYFSNIHLQKKQILLLLACCLTQGLSAQFLDDFETYNANEYLTPQSSIWETWSGTSSGTDDVKVKEGNAKSGTKAIHLATGLNSAPDIVLPFNAGNELTTGKLNFNFSIFVENSANLLLITGAENWVIEAVFKEDGMLEIKKGDQSIVIEVPYEKERWMDLTFSIDFTIDWWSVILDGVCFHAFDNFGNSFHSLNLYTKNADSYWIDDVSFDYDPNYTYSIDASISAGREIRESGYIGSERHISGTITSEADSIVTSVGISYTSGAISQTKMLTGLNLSIYESVDFEMDLPHVLIEGENVINLAITSVNGINNDDFSCNNVRQVTTFGVTAAPNKRVLGEEVTGTWCGWCPRGQVNMERMEHRFSDLWVGIAVHGSDVMEHPPYYSGLNLFTFPRVKIMREVSINPADIVNPFFEAISQPAAGYFNNTTTWDEDRRTLDITTTLIGMSDVPADYHVAMAIIEDEVTGTGSEYNQVNNYSGLVPLVGVNGVDWYELPNPVPATDMVYNHVARAILPDFNGTPLGDVLTAGDSTQFNFSYVVPEAYDINQLKVIAILIRDDGKVDNVKDDFVELGLTGTTELAFANSIHIFPNPTSEVSHVKLKLEESAALSIEVRSLMGQLVAQKNYGQQQGELFFPIDVTAFTDGIYLIKIQVGNEFVVRKLSVQK